MWRRGRRLSCQHQAKGWQYGLRGLCWGAFLIRRVGVGIGVGVVEERLRWLVGLARDVGRARHRWPARVGSDRTRDAHEKRLRIAAIFSRSSAASAHVLHTPLGRAVLGRKTGLKREGPGGRGGQKSEQQRPVALQQGRAAGMRVRASPCHRGRKGSAALASRTWRVFSRRRSIGRAAGWVAGLARRDRRAGGRRAGRRAGRCVGTWQAPPMQSSFSLQSSSAAQPPPSPKSLVSGSAAAGRASAQLWATVHRAQPPRPTTQTRYHLCRRCAPRLERGLPRRCSRSRGPERSREPGPAGTWQLRAEPELERAERACSAFSEEHARRRYLLGRNSLGRASGAAPSHNRVLMGPESVCARSS